MPDYKAVSREVEDEATGKTRAVVELEPLSKSDKKQRAIDAAEHERRVKAEDTQSANTPVADEIADIRARLDKLEGKTK